MAMDDQTFLTGKLLVAMPGMPDSRFAQSVIYMCVHSERGAMGLIVNRIAENVGFEELLEQVGVKEQLVERTIAVHIGGPVESGLGFVLHSSEYGIDGTLNVDERIRLTASVEVLKEIARGRGPLRCLLALGYSGWGPGQLEREIRQNGWLIVDSDEEIVFGTGVDEKWRGALAKMGIDPTMLSSSAGRA
jgi:putative transcriptional regulator